MDRSRSEITTVVPSDVETFDPASVSQSVGRTRETDNAVPVIDGYKISECLGAGGMGTVWRAQQLSTRREVALKLMSMTVARSPSACARFDREVELAARLEHPNIARVYDSGLHQGIYFYAMELIDGQPLDVFVANNRLTRQQILELMRTVCMAVQHAHQRGVIHRDLKPSNILVGNDGQPHVVDFGLAKALLQDDSSVTTDDRSVVSHPISIDGDIAGTPAYMSPEQAAGRVREIDTRSDVYSLGVIFYQLLIGSSPHELTGTSYEIMRRKVDEDIRRPRSVSRTIDRELEAVLLKALARKPEQRYASAGELAQDITNYLEGDILIAKRQTSAYFLMRKVRKHALPLGTVASVLVAASIYAGWRYVQPANVELNTNPAGAAVYVDGVKDKCCTNTTLRLPFGKHKIELHAPDGYLSRELDVTVRWGQALGSPFGKASINLAPNFQPMMFDTRPAGARVEIRPLVGTGATFTLITPAHVSQLPAGAYAISVEKDGYERYTSTFEVRGDMKPIHFDRELEPRRR